MLRFTSGSKDRRPHPRPSQGTRCERLTFGGVAFELLSSAPLPHDLLGPDQRYLAPGLDARAVADVACAVHVNPGGLDPDRLAAGAYPNEIRLAAGADPAVTRVRARTLDVELRRLSPQHYAASAQIAPTPDALVGLLRAIVAAVVHREGGVMLHAAGIELDGRAVLFIGPSGAGKSTAVGLSDGARCFAYDHVAIVPSAGGYLAWGLPGGKPAEAPLAADVAYPIAAVLRVRKAPPNVGSPELTVLHGAQALFAMRESVECADPTPGGEDVYLHAATKLSTRITVGTIATVLGRSHGSLLRSFLQQADATGARREQRS